jgi:Tol biopolymer transport system component
MAGCTDDGGSGSNDSIDWASSLAVTAEEKPEPPEMHFGFRIATSNSASSNIEWLTDGERDDYKPAYSPDGSKITFFRVFDYGAGFQGSWKSKLCVMNADGSDVRELTAGEYLDATPYWTRDGTNRIVFHRLYQGHKIYITSPDANVDDEQLISDPDFWDRPWSSLADGRILVSREAPYLAHFLLTPNVGGTPIYEEISYPIPDTNLNHMTISPSETKVAYMKVADTTPGDLLSQEHFWDTVIAYADFDADNLRIENEVEVTEYDDTSVDWYPSWSPDEKYIVYAHSGVIRAYSLETGITEQISSRDDLDYRYPTVVGQTK